jgi:hypothetical protein
MKYIFILLFINSFSQELLNDSLYIVTRGTTDKSNIIGSNFNLHNKNITHVGIGVIEEGQLKIYNIMPSEEKNNLLVDDFESFFNKKNIFFKGIWSCPINPSDISFIKEKLTYFKSINLKYDYEFNINNQNYYCSEFVANILNSIPKFKFIPTKTNNSFEYYSADFFISDSRFKLVYLNEINQLTK